MGKITSTLRNQSIKTSLFLYVATSFAVAFILITLCLSVCERINGYIRSNYSLTTNIYYLADENGIIMGEGAEIIMEEYVMSQRDSAIVSFLETLQSLIPFVIIAGSIMICTFLFYKFKLKKPIEILSYASSKIAGNDLEFEIEYLGEDELGKLCTSFEKMRKELYNNNRKMWRQLEERKHVNSMFAHELRTPLTVLKGYTDILRLSEDAMIIETTESLSNNIQRLEKYVDSMSNIQKIDSLTPNFRELGSNQLITECIRVTETTPSSYIVECEDNARFSQLCIDDEMILQAFGNVFSNALRYASEKITIIFEQNELEELFIIRVCDDGEGFSEDSLHKAKDVFYSSEGNHGGHFGLGLYISSLYCKWHQGDITIENGVHGAIVSISFKERN